jgi:hypothetical protein
MPKRAALALAALAALTLAPRGARAGGGPVNVMVVYSADDAQATAVAKHYEKARSLPPGHLCGIAGITPAMTTIDAATFATLIQKPLDGCFAKAPEPDEIDYLVLVRGLPYSVTLPAYAASLEAVLQVFHATKTSDSTELAGAGQPGNTQAQVPNPAFVGGFANAADFTIMNKYQDWYGSTSTIIRAKQQPVSFRRADAKSAGGYAFAKNLFIVSALDGFDYTDADALVDRGVAADGASPPAELLCMRGEDEARQARDPECELATRMLKNAGLSGAFVDPFDAMLAGHTVASFFTGSSDSVRTAIAGNTFAPGAIADNLTSYGAAISNFACSPDGMTCPASEAQTSIARFIRAGATGAEGTVNEPLNNCFPNAGTLLHYTFGYSLGESFLFNQRFLYWQNILLGDPLATPYGERPKVTIDGGPGPHPIDAPLVVHATHPAGVAKIALYAAGVKQGEAMGDTLSLDLKGKIGDAFDLLAVAFANNAKVTRAGWPTPDQQPRPDVQGWIAAQVTIAAAMPDAGGATGAGGGGGAGAGGGAATGGAEGGAGGGATTGGATMPGAKSGCGCRAAGGEAGGWGALLSLSTAALALARVRRRYCARALSARADRRSRAAAPRAC